MLPASKQGLPGIFFYTRLLLASCSLRPAFLRKIEEGPTICFFVGPSWIPYQWVEFLPALDVVGIEIVQEVGCTDRSADDKDDPAFFALLGKAQNAEAKQHAGNHKIGYGNPEKVPRQTGKIYITQKEHRPLSTILASRWFVSYPPLYQENTKDIIILPNRNRSVKVLTR